MKNLILYNNSFENGSKEIIEVDLSNCKNENDIFNVFKVAFRFPEWFGENWNAFDDCMQNLCFDIKDTLIVRVYGLQTIIKISEESVKYILQNLVGLSKGESTQDNGEKVDAIIYLNNVDDYCEKIIKEMSCNFIIQ
ncbi:MAG: barstar family protein [Clostridia bacterium]